ncbi:MAG TPA: DUF1559 domain-containing protein [Planctomycetaceae bacterium]|nr:DUF1559 domain-containing protein [Planctomycetaceae bacterium]
MAIDSSVMWRWMRAALIAFFVLLVIALILPATQQAREAARRSQSKNNLRQLGMAFANYHATYSVYPPGGTFNAKGRGHHGWTTSLLGYMDASTIYSLVDFKQPWDGPENADFFRIRFPLLLNPSIPDSTPEGEFAVSHYSANSNLLAANSAVSQSDIPDHSQTFIVGELGGDFVPWGCPYNWRWFHTLTDTPQTYGRPEGIGGHFLMVDGSVHWVSADASEDVLRAMRGRNHSYLPGKGLKITRPDSFPFPADAPVLDEVRLNGGTYTGWRNGEGRLVKLRIFGGKVRELSDADLSGLEEFPYLIDLSAWGEFTDEGIAPIGTLQKLRTLRLASMKFTDEGLTRLSGLKELRVLNVENTATTREGRAALREALANCKILPDP